MSTPTPVQQVCLVLSPYAARELAGLIERGGNVADAVAGHPRVLDGIAAECRDQLSNLTTKPVITVHEVTDDELAAASPEYAAVIAKRMAEAAAKAVKDAA